MPIKRTVTKSKKDGVKKKTVTTSSRIGSVTKTKAKGKTGKGKTTTVSNKKGKMVGTASKAKTRNTRSGKKMTEKEKTIALGKGRTASTKKGKGAAYGGKYTTRKVTSGGSGDTFSRTEKTKFGQGGLRGKRKDTTRGTTKQVVSRGSMKSGMPKASGGTKVAGMRTSTKIGRGPMRRKSK